MVLVGISISPGIGARGEAHGSTSPGETRGAVEPAETVEQYKARMRAEVERAIATNRYPDLYGRVVDEKGQSIAGASVQFSWNDISDNGTSRTKRGIGFQRDVHCSRREQCYHEGFKLPEPPLVGC